MSTLCLQNQKFYLDGYDLSGDMNAIAINFAADMVEETAFGDDTHIFKGGLKVATMALEGYVEGGTDKVDEIMFNNMAVANKPISIGVETGADGELAYILQSILADYSPGGSVGEMFAFSVTAETSSEGLIRGTIMHNAAQSTSGNGTARQLGAVTSGQQLTAALHVIAASGSTPTLDITVESDDNSGMTSATTRATFTQATAIGSQVETLSGPVTDDWWRIDFTIGGGTPSFTFVVVLGIQ